MIDGRIRALTSDTTKPTELAYAIRNYRATDFDRLWEIDQLCFPPGIAYTQMELDGFLNHRNAITLVGEAVSADAEGDDLRRIAGFVVAHPVRRKYGRILTLDILPQARRSGLATKLMHVCEERLHALGCGEIYLETAVNNEPAIRLYRKLGYQVLGTIPDYYSSHSLDAYQMAKQL